MHTYARVVVCLLTLLLRCLRYEKGSGMMKLNWYSDGFNFTNFIHFEVGLDLLRDVISVPDV